jgi:hypothetical protein
VTAPEVDRRREEHVLRSGAHRWDEVRHAHDHLDARGLGGGGLGSRRGRDLREPPARGLQPDDVRDGDAALGLAAVVVEDPRHGCSL